MKTLQKVRQRFYWSTARVDVEKWRQTCDACVTCKGQRRVTVGNFTSIIQQHHSNGSPSTPWVLFEARSHTIHPRSHELFHKVDRSLSVTPTNRLLLQRMGQCNNGCRDLTHPYRFIPTKERILPLLYSKDYVNLSTLTKRKQHLYIHNGTAWWRYLNAPF